MALPVDGPSGTRGGGASSRGDESCDESVVIDEGAVATAAAAAEDFEDAVSIGSVELIWEVVIERTVPWRIVKGTYTKVGYKLQRLEFKMTFEPEQTFVFYTNIAFRGILQWENQKTTLDRLYYRKDTTLLKIDNLEYQHAYILWFITMYDFLCFWSEYRYP